MGKQRGLLIVGGFCLMACGRLGFSSSDTPDARPDDAPDAGVSGFALDPAFGKDGVVVLDQGGISNLTFAIDALAIGPDGRIVIAGTGGTASNTDTLVARLLDDGSLDTSFGAGGIALVDVTPTDSSRSVDLQPDGRLVIGAAGADKGQVIRLAADGSIDPTFGTTSPGVTIVDFPGDPDSPNGAYVAMDGRIVFGGQARSATMGYDFVTARLDATGSLDPSFGGTGATSHDFFSADEFGSPRTVLPDGRIYLAGSTWHGPAQFDAVVARLLPDGSLDPSFAGAGFVARDFDRTDRADGLAVDSAGRVVVVGHAGEGADQDAFVIRYLADGAPDTTFANGTGVLLDLGGVEQAMDVLPLPDGRIVVAGATDHGGEQAVLVAVLRDDGTLDATIGRGGLLELDVVAGQDDRAWNLAQDPAGRIVVLGQTSDNGQNDLVILRLVP